MRGRSSRGRRGARGRKQQWGEGNGFEEAGGYMNAKKNKLITQFREDTDRNQERTKSSIFNGVAIFVNGYTDPPSDQLRMLMMAHGGTYHHYFMPRKTTHVIATNLPDTKIKNLKDNDIIVHPNWILESVKAGALKDYRSFLLYSNAAKNQPQIQFEKVVKNANDENFIEEFYGNSRLHHISSMANNFKRLVSEMRDSKLDEVFPARDGYKHLKLRSSNEPSIMHLDMDCFFVSVGLRSRPELVGKAIGVTHSKSGEGPSASCDSMAEISSCSYEARNAGVKNGMFVGNAKRLCPEIQFIPYEFDAYIQVAKKLYEIVANYTLDIQAVSCDEMLIDLKSINVDPIEFAEFLRSEIFEKTGCRASAGIGSNILLAKLATRNAKPNGVFMVSSNENEIMDFMKSVSLASLPGIGRKMARRLSEKWDLSLCGEARSKLTLQDLQEEFGTKTGKTIYNGIRGITETELSFVHERKSVSAEVNYGIRFKEMDEAHDFLDRLSKEVAIRCRNLNISGGRSVTLKLMIRAEGASEETSKYLGHGVCDNKSKTSTLSVATREKSVILREAKNLLRKIDVNVSDIRGVGIQIGKLDTSSGNDSVDGSASIMMSFISKKTPMESINKSDSMDSVPDSTEETYEKSLSMSQIDKDVFESLPNDIRIEIESQMGKNIETKVSPQPTTAQKKIRRPSPSITYSQLDPEVLAHLPQELLNEVKDTYGAGPSTRSSNKGDAFKVLMSPTKSPVKRSPVKRRGRPRLTDSPRKPGRPRLTGSPRKPGRPRLTGSPTKKPGRPKIRIPIKQQPLETNPKTVEANYREEEMTSLEFAPEPPPSEADLNGVKDLEGIRTLLFEWQSQTEVPTEDDKETVSDFLMEKLSESEFDFVRRLLLQLRRLVSPLEVSSPWKMFYLDLNDKVQTHMLRKTGMRLFL